MKENKNYIISVTLDEKSLVRYNETITKERDCAICDLIESSNFNPIGDFKGPFRLHLSRNEKILIIDIISEKNEPLLAVPLPLYPLKNIIKDYFALFESYSKANQYSSCRKLEALDMGRRSLHNEAAEIILNSLSEAIKMDGKTARAFFTLICVLHLRAM